MSDFLAHRSLSPQNALGARLFQAMLSVSRQAARARASLSSVLSSQVAHVRVFSTAPAAADPVTLNVTADGIAVVRFDAPGEKVNTLSAALMKTFDSVMTRLETDPSIKAAVLISGKPDSFIAGADISMLVRGGIPLPSLSRAG